MGQAFGRLRYLFFTFLPDQLLAKLPVTRADLVGRTFLVTGSNTGIGLALAIHLARLNPGHLILAVRDLRKGEMARQEIVAQTGFTGLLEVWELDMAEFGSVKRFAERANSTLKRLDGAVLNAGIHAKNGTLQVNVLSTGLLGILLLPLLHSTARLPPPHPDASQTPPHLTFTGSGALFLASFPEKTAPNILQVLNDEGKTNAKDRYPTSKLLDLFLAREIAGLPKAQGVVVNVVDPGLCISELGRDMDLKPAVLFILMRLGWTTAKGALNLLYAVLTPTPPGAYISAGEIRQPSSWSRSRDGLRVQKQVWSEMLDVWRRIAPEVAEII
ncbi:putative short-chain dehydrogenase [Mycena leptocephala]|nr:putative short-chain dehydrogenase [Mycena leptocephala]